MESTVHEEWRPVQGKFAGFPYEVSNQGQVRRTEGGRLLKPYRNRDTRRPHQTSNYMMVWMSMSGQRQQMATVHSLVAEAFICSRPEGQVVNHKDSNKENNHVHNLEWVSPRENTLHAIASRPKHWLAKLTEDDIKAIRKKYPGESMAEISRQYQVTATTIRKIIRRQIWKHVG